MALGMHIVSGCVLASRLNLAPSAQYPIAQPSARPSEPPQSTPVLGSRTIICARPKVLVMMAACPTAFIGPLTLCPILSSSAITSSEIPLSSDTTPSAVPSRMQNRGASMADCGSILKSTRLQRRLMCPCGNTNPRDYKLDGATAAERLLVSAKP